MWEDVNDDARSGRLSTSTTDENMEAVKKLILDNHRITIGEFSDFYGFFGHATCCGENCSKIAKFWAKTTSHLLKKVITGDESWVYGLLSPENTNRMVYRFKF